MPSLPANWGQTWLVDRHIPRASRTRTSTELMMTILVPWIRFSLFIRRRAMLVHIRPRKAQNMDVGGSTRAESSKSRPQWRLLTKGAARYGRPLSQRRYWTMYAPEKLVL